MNLYLNRCDGGGLSAVDMRSNSRDGGRIGGREHLGLRLRLRCLLQLLLLLVMEFLLLLLCQMLLLSKFRGMG